MVLAGADFFIVMMEIEQTSEGREVIRTLRAPLFSDRT